MTELLTIVGVFLAVEGALYAAFPAAAKRLAAQIAQQGEEALRVAGLLALVLGVVCVWLVRGTGS